MSLLFYKLLDVLHRHHHPAQLTVGIMLGLCLGLNPWATLQGVVFLALLPVLRVNLGTTLASFLIFRAIGWVAEPIFDGMGTWLLTKPGLRYFWTSLYHAPIVPYTRFNHTDVLGAGVMSVALMLPIAFLGPRCFRLYGARWEQAILNLNFLRLYEEYRQSQR